MDQKKKALAAAGVLVAAALAATGTWAYTNFVQNETNEVAGTSSPGVRLHDDFANISSAVVNKEENKDIYVENYGDHPQFVRLRLTELLTRGDSDYLPVNADPADPTTWFVHIPRGAGANVADPTDDQFHDWWTWQLGGQKWYLPTTITQDDNPAADQNTTVYDGSEDGVKQTLDSTGQVITMADYWALTDDEARKAFQGWVWDTDGWAYWVGPLLPGQATGLLLSAVTMTVIPEASSYEYKINVALQAATSEDIDKFYSLGGSLTAEAAKMLNLFTAKAPQIVLGQAAVTLPAVEGTAWTLDLNDYFADPNYGDTVTFQVVTAATTVVGTAPAIDADGHTLKYTPVAGDVGAGHVIVVTATDQDNQVSAPVTITLTVTAAA
ncbi:MAG: hypothetical protein LBR33_06840 [Propionibacteriaceae bacterium]|jgi:hypothetical protein|nr:hypothetical protein [Propionibacteriaceae bacterium]